MLSVHLENMIEDVEWGNVDEEDDAYQYAVTLVEDYVKDGTLTKDEAYYIMSILDNLDIPLDEAFKDVVVYLEEKDER